ncbi:MAG: Maf family protein [Chromatiales bacterium]|jgi:septum formation protein|nr:Maf family protein [Chromatiales bacterium]MDX9767844.1 Maf family protein [Ectothiorhodospiraceae bacterium]
MNPVLVLASASPRRRQLLEQIGIACLVRPADVDETPRADETAPAFAARLAFDKARAVRNDAGLPVLGADTVVVVDGRMLGKPRDRADGLDMLERLSGRSHEVISAVAMVRGGHEAGRVSVSAVRFRAITAAEREAYWASGEPADKAGAYAIQGLGALFVEHLEGSYSGVMGLPLFETGELLAAFGIRVLGVRREA